jgi:hypothetical protein
MAGSWKNIKGLFWQSPSGGPPSADGAPGPDGAAAGAEMSDADFATFLQGNPHAVPKQAIEPVEPGSVQVKREGDAVSIDFQAQYDLAGIPDTDEVEQLENFLARLDPALPHASKLAAATAFLGAIGKDMQAVLADAERKILRVRGILVAKEDETQQSLGAQQAEIDALQAKIEERRKHMEELNRVLEGVRKACVVEESRLQAARIFFGAMAAGAGAAPGAPSPTTNKGMKR